MTVLPIELRALALVRRRAERAGQIAPPSELEQLVSSIECTPEEIDRAFGLFVFPNGRMRELVRARLVEDEGGEWVLTSNGERLAGLLAEYGDRRQSWSPSIEAPSLETEAFALVLYIELLIGTWADATEAWHAQLTDRYRLGVVNGIEQALAAVDDVVREFGLDPVEIRGLLDAGSAGEP